MTIECAAKVPANFESDSEIMNGLRWVPLTMNSTTPPYLSPRNDNILNTRNGDTLEARDFAFFALRSLDGLPLTVPSTTGVSGPVAGGQPCRRATG